MGDDLKKGILVLAMLISLTFVFAANEEVFFSLERDVYGVSENFDGTISVNHSGMVSVGENFIADVSSCGDYSRQISLYDILDNSGMADFDEFEYSTGSSASSLTENFNGGDTHLFAFYLPRRLVNNVSFKISGNGGPFYLDIANDGLDWKYLDVFTGWDEKTYSDEYDDNCYPPGGSYEIAGPGICENIDLVFDEFQGESDLNINAVVRKTGDGTLKVRIGSEACELTGIGSDWTDVSCQLHENVYNGTNTFRVCFSTTSNSFQIPTCVGTDHHYLSLQKGVYDTDLPSSAKVVNSNALINLVKNYMSSTCFGNWCIIPVAMYMVSAGDVSLSDLRIEYTGGASLEFYELFETYSETDINGREIPLNAFEDLKTPSIKGDNCSLRVSFMGGSWEENFTVTDVPEAVIETSADHVLKGTSINFDGTNSSAPGNRTIVKWSWDFGDNNTADGSVVQHVYLSDNDYTVKLTVEDNAGLKGVSEKVIHVVGLEEFLDNEFPVQIEKVSGAITSFVNISGITKEFFDKMGYNTLLLSSNNSIHNLKSEFDETKASTNLSDENKSAKYADIASSLNEVLETTPARILYEDGISYENFKLDTPLSIPDYSGTLLSNEKRNSLYFFNQRSVRVDFDANLIDVEYLNGDKQSFEYVDKKVSVFGGSNNVLVEDFRGFNLDDDLFIFTSGYEVDNNSGVVYWDIVQDISYAVKSGEIIEINSVVFSDVEIGGGDYVYDCAEASSGVGCCGDGVCDIADYLGVNEKDSSNPSYCPSDCKKELPIATIIVLGAILIFGILYINVYKGPGNFKQITNAISYNLFHRRIFVSERDKIILKQYVSNALARGYTKEQVKNSLLAKGWTKKQVKFALKGKI